MLKFLQLMLKILKNIIKYKTMFEVETEILAIGERNLIIIALK